MLGTAVMDLGRILSTPRPLVFYSGDVATDASALSTRQFLVERRPDFSFSSEGGRYGHRLLLRSEQKQLRRYGRLVLLTSSCFKGPEVPVYHES